MNSTAAPYGTWTSPISAESLAAAAIEMSDLRVDGGQIYWRESRPAERGRQVIVQMCSDGEVTEHSPAEHSVRSRVHEYGGNSYLQVGVDLFFVSFADQRLYWQHGQRAPIALTPDGFQYIDFSFDPNHQVILAIREDHRPQTVAENSEERNEIVAIAYPDGEAAQPNAGIVLVSGDDFYAYPRLSADGKRLAWIAWNHPDMPWDRSILQVADFNGSGVSNLRAIVDQTKQSANEPRWAANGSLYFVNDPDNWWNLYRWDGERTTEVARMPREMGGPLWTLGGATYALRDGLGALVRSSYNGVDQLDLIDSSGSVRTLDLPFVEFEEVQLLDANTAVALASAADPPQALIRIDLLSGAWRTLHQPVSLGIAPTYLSRALAIEFPTQPAPDGSARTAHAWYCSPTNPDFHASEQELPPLIVTIHGGPTSATGPHLHMRTQFWTSRGFAVVDVNYGGSTGLGRTYRERLLGQWGIVDVQDAVAAVDYLVAEGRVDGERAAIRGGSAGGYTALAALAFSDRFKAGANLYGVADISSLAASCHKFERHYVVSVVGPASEALYRERSPLHHLDGFDAPLITLQGSEDKVVPPQQSRMIVAALEAKGVANAYIEFDGEQHGFRQAPNIIRAQQAELYFYGQIFGFQPADRIEPVAIRNWP